jgi:RNA polymerase sigma factor (sigma-70 family)
MYELTELDYEKARNIAWKLCKSQPAYFEDCVQRAHLTLWRKSLEYDPEFGVSNFWCFAYKGVEGAVKDALRLLTGSRRKIRRSFVSIDSLSKNLEAVSVDFLLPSVPAHSYEVALDKALDKLLPRHREVIIRYYFEGQTCEEIGEQMGFNQTRASQIRRAALAKLHAQMKPNTGQVVFN